MQDFLTKILGNSRLCGLLYYDSRKNKRVQLDKGMSKMVLLAVFWINPRNIRFLRSAYYLAKKNA